MKVLVTGGAGFVARHLRAELVSVGHDVVLTDIAGDGMIAADLVDASAMRQLVAAVRPDACVHLGAVSFVPDAARNQEAMRRVNVDGTENLLRAFALEACHARILLVSSAQVLVHPLSAYAVSKLKAEEMLARYPELDSLVARPANHTGPGQASKFVVPAFVRQALEIKDGLRECFRVGNLASVRDFTDVRDVARAYRMLLDKGSRGCIYPISSGKRFRIDEVLDVICDIIGIDAPRCVDATLFRPTDASPTLDVSSLYNLGWVPRFSLNQTISDMIEDTLSHR